MVKLLRCVCPSAFLWVLLCFIVHLVLLFFLSFTYTVYLSVCLSVSCLCLWAMLPELNKMMMMMMLNNTNYTRTTNPENRLQKVRGRVWGPDPALRGSPGGEPLNRYIYFSDILDNCSVWFGQYAVFVVLMTIVLGEILEQGWVVQSWYFFVRHHIHQFMFIHYCT